MTQKGTLAANPGPNRPSYERLKGRLDWAAYQRSLRKLDRRYSWTPEAQRVR